MGVLRRWLESRRRRRHLHRDSCSDTALRQLRQRQYLERLRDAGIPRASDDLTARLLARTPELASAQPAGANGRPYTVAQRALRISLLAAGGTAAGVALMAGSAYLMGGEAPSNVAGAASSAFVDQHLPVRDTAPGSAGRAPGSGWNLTGAATLTPAGALTAAQLNGLRAQGWTCPELRELGYHLVWARAGAAAGGDLLELRLTDGQHFATVLEQHGAASTPPVNVLTGHPATADGFTPATFQGMGLPVPATGGPSSGGGALWINAAAPFRAIYQTSSATFTYVSDQSAEQADDAVAALVRARDGAPAANREAGTAARGTGDETDVVTARMERGLGRILEFLAP